jgi:hypothetical protein
MPNTPQEGRDPFFPNSPRLFAASINKNVAIPVVTPKAELLLKGFSGPPDHRLAIINNRTFAAGESADVHTANGLVRVRCLEIKGDHASVLVGAERRELRLRNGL